MTVPVNTRTIPPPSAHGDDVASVASAIGVDPSSVLDLAQTVNPVAPDIADLARNHLEALHRYPDPAAATKVLATVLGQDAERVVLTNGGAEAIALIAQELRVGWVEEPDFGLYRRHLAALEPRAGRWRSNPHSPTGRLASPDEDAAVWDEAFWPLTTGTWTRGDASSGAIVVGSLTKLFACPGLRLGYVMAPDEHLASAFRDRQPRWSVNGLAASMLPDLIEDADLAGWSARAHGLHTELVAELRARGLDVDAADAPWVLVRRHGLREDLARHAVLVRDCASFGMRDTFRIATPREDDMPRLLSAIDRILENDRSTFDDR